MTQAPSSDHRRGARSAAAVAVLLLLAGAVVLGLGLRGSAETPGAPAAAQTPSLTGVEPAPQVPSERPAAKDARGPSTDLGPFLPGSEPVALDIARIGVRADKIVDLGLADDGSIEVPTNPANPGWFTPGPTPGQFGPAIIAGHVDGKSGPAVFYRLRELRPGDRVKVTRRDGSRASFAIDRVLNFDKDAFPTRQVYGATKRAELRLITCGGAYDEKTGYLQNTVAFAHLVDPG